MKGVRRHLALVAVAASAAACSGDDDLVATSEDAVTARIETRSELPLPELSGLARRAVDGRFVAIGDREPTVLTFRLDAAHRPTDITRHDVARLFGDSVPQWEAVATDGAGRIAVLAEAKGTVTFLAPDLATVLHTITLEIPPAHPLADAWARDANARGEGLVLLRNGHVLVVKEKSPPLLVELAPRGTTAAGYRPGDAATDDAFPLPAGRTSTMVPVHQWSLKSHDERRLGDLSEASVDAKGRLLLLSDQSRRIVRTERVLDPGEAKIDLDAEWKLPDAIEKPEGLIFDGVRPVVVSDVADASKKALFVLGAL